MLYTDLKAQSTLTPSFLKPENFFRFGFPSTRKRAFLEMTMMIMIGR